MREVPVEALPEHDSLEVGGSTRSFEEFVEAEHVRLYRALFLITGARHETEELMQDAFLRVWERWERVGTMDDPTGYLFRTAMNLWRNRLRRAGLALRTAVTFAPSEDPFVAVEDQDAVFRALRKLTSNQRAALVTTSLFGYSSEEAGALLGMSAATVRMHASRGRAALKQLMGEPA
jgi:RNA polymerase sigma-70 factor (ECF subfamily)